VIRVCVCERVGVVPGCHLDSAACNGCVGSVGTIILNSGFE
jgi:hypothetical protein